MVAKICTVHGYSAGYYVRCGTKVLTKEFSFACFLVYFLILIIEEEVV